jgi:hypothetical protein
MSESLVNDYHVSLAFDVLKTQDANLVCSLRDFLSVIPSSKSIELILIKAIYQLVENHPESSQWILTNPNYLMPQFDLVHWALNTMRNKLISSGLINKGKDFEVDWQAQKLYVRPEYLSGIWENLSEKDTFILSKLLVIDSL